MAIDRSRSLCVLLSSRPHSLVCVHQLLTVLVVVSVSVRTRYHHTPHICRIFIIRLTKWSCWNPPWSSCWPSRASLPPARSSPSSRKITPSKTSTFPPVSIRHSIAVITVHVGDCNGISNNNIDNRMFKVNGETRHVRFAVGFDRFFFSVRHCLTTPPYARIRYQKIKF